MEGDDRSRYCGAKGGADTRYFRDAGRRQPPRIPRRKNENWRSWKQPDDSVKDILDPTLATNIAEPRVADLSGTL